MFELKVAESNERYICYIFFMSRFMLSYDCGEGVEDCRVDSF